ncbi:MAG: nucleotide exchange factor GrpE [Desulfomonile tiedjei]|nr:nucleotide exchange factor GrpE [Desulfomonile tiedjei]
MSDQREIKVNFHASNGSKQDKRADEPTALQEHPPTEPAVVAQPAGEPQPGGAPEQQPPSMEEAVAEAALNRDRWLRAVADLENYKKRVAQERSKLLKYRNEDLLKDLLAIVDNMDRALAHCTEDTRGDSLAEGVCMVAEMFRNVLERYGVTEIKALGQPFDPYVHEALAKIPDASRPPNQVIEVLEKGYLYHDRLLRAAKVVVSTEPTEV